MFNTKWKSTEQDAECNSNKGKLLSSCISFLATFEQRISYNSLSKILAFKGKNIKVLLDCKNTVWFFAMNT